MFTYHNDPEKTKKAYNDKGWSTLGDVGYLDAEGFLYLTDRKSYMIISGGVNIYPQETEDVLITHPAVSDVAVFGVPNEEMGEEVKAVVQPHDMAKAGKELEAELIVFCRKHLSPIKCPKSIDFEAGAAAHADRQAGEASSAGQVLAEGGGKGIAPGRLRSFVKLISSCPGLSRASTSLQSRFTKRRGCPGSTVKTRFALCLAMKRKMS